jgi:hypothetical protein
VLSLTLAPAALGQDIPPVQCDCAGERPPLVDRLTTPFDPGLVAAAPNYDAVPTDPALWLVDLGNQGAAPVGTNWNTDRYTHPAWTMANLGGIFGVTLDGTGNVFVGHSAVYNDWTGTGDQVGFGGAGAVYRIDGATGTPTLVIKLPQQVDASQPAGQQFPGLGQLSWSCPTSRLFVSNFEDGRIYSINAGSGAVHAYDFATGNIAGPMNGTGMQLKEAGDPVGAAPLGERVWAVKVAGDRVYYSVWNQDGCNPNAGANTIRSVGLTAAGAFVAGTVAVALRSRRTFYLCLFATWIPLAALVLGTGGNRVLRLGNLEVDPRAAARKGGGDCGNLDAAPLERLFCHAN